MVPKRSGSRIGLRSVTRKVVFLPVLGNVAFFAETWPVGEGVVTWARWVTGDGDHLTRRRVGGRFVGCSPAAAADAKAPGELLGEYLVILADAALSGRAAARTRACRRAAAWSTAAEQGVDANQAVDLYLSAAWRLWQEIPMVVRSRDRDKVRAAADAVLRVVSDAVEVLVDGHQAARRQMIRQEESARREFIDDLLRGDADVSRLVQRAEPFGLDLGRNHQVLLAAPVNFPDIWTMRRLSWNGSSSTISETERFWSPPRTACW